VTAGRSPRVLVDATSVPADRGGVGRYVDGLLGALGRRDDVDLAVVCLRPDVERYERLLPKAQIAAAPAAARLTEINVTAIEPFADGMAFGDAGAYERVKGTFRGELDPADPRNKVIKAANVKLP